MEYTELNTENTLEKIKEILESDADVLVETADETTEEVKITVKDSRYEEMMTYLSWPFQDDEYHSELIKLISQYVGPLYYRKIEESKVRAFGKSGECVNATLNVLDIFNLSEANKEFAQRLYGFVCNILEHKKAVKLDRDTLIRLLNPAPSKKYTYRQFDFERLADAMKDHRTLEISGFTTDDIYEILIATNQIGNDEVFASLVAPEEFKKSHQKIDEFLMGCNAVTFWKVTKIIRRNFDENFDRLTFIKKRADHKFCESLIMQIIPSTHDESDDALVHSILSDERIAIDYDRYYTDCTDQTDLRTLVATSEDRRIVRDLLAREDNVRDFYHHGGQCVELYSLYAIAGEYGSAIAKFQELYDYQGDYGEDFDDDFNRVGYTKADMNYTDSLIRFVGILCKSFELDEIKPSRRMGILTRILISEKVKYVNLSALLTIIKPALAPEDFKVLLALLIGRHNEGNLGFLTVTESEGFDDHFTFTVSTEEEIKQILAEINQAAKTIELKKDESK